MELYTVNTGHIKFDGGAMFGIVPKVLWQRQYDADENNLIPGTMRSLLVVEGDRKVMFDCGIGDKQEEKFFSYYALSGKDTIESSLAEIGLTVDDITDLVLTHLHFDHCGGAIRYNEDQSKLMTTFPQATYWVSEEQWQHALNPNRLEKASFLDENILPMEASGQLQLFEEDFNLTPNIQIRLFNGHTRGQAIALIRYKNRIVVNIADLVPLVGNISTSWVCGYDTQPEISLLEKESFLKESVDNDYIFYFYHEIDKECCTLKNTEKGIRADRFLKLEEI